MIKVVHCHNCNGTGSLKTIDDCEVCNGVGTYRIISRSTINKYNLEKSNFPFIEVHGHHSEQAGFFSQNDRQRNE